MNRLCTLVLLLLLFLFVLSCRVKESFVNETCADYQTCVSCANKSSCTWCSSTNTCMPSADINDTVCASSVSHVSECEAEQADGTNPPGETVSNTDMDDNALYHDQIDNAPFPPNAYINEDIMYSPETVMANVSNLRNEVQNIQQFIAQQN
jgi:hypothetical protein